MGPDCERSWILGVFGVGDGQGGLACYNSWARKESDTTEQLHFDKVHQGLPWWLSSKESAKQEMWVQSLGWGRLLEKEMATHSSILGLPWWLSW